jgi:hypothetical protein
LRRCAGLVLALATVLAAPARGAEATGGGLRLADGAMGAVYLVEQTRDQVTIKVVFPDRLVQGERAGTGDYESTEPVAGPRFLELLDDRGVLARLTPPPPLVHRFWCANDGGVQWRAEATLTLPARALARPLRPVPHHDGVAAFALAYSGARPSPHTASKPRGRLLRTGSLGGTTPAAFLWAEPDDAQNCSEGPPEDQWLTLLRVGRRDDPLRCCGP